MKSLHLIDWIVVGLYFLLILGIAWWVISKKPKPLPISFWPGAIWDDLLWESRLLYPILVRNIWLGCLTWAQSMEWRWRSLLLFISISGVDNKMT